MEVLVSKISPWVNEEQNVIVLGDFNARVGSSIHKYLEDIGFTFSNVRGSTYHFDRGINLFGAIDHIATGPDIKTKGPSRIFQRKLGSVWPADHYPTYLDINLGL